MHLALIADVHGNLEALDAVLEDLDRRAPRARIVCAGDLVGYGPDPEACIERLGGRGALCVLGNHDEMVLGRRDFTRCVRAGILAAVWSREHLGPDAHAFLRGLPAWLDTGDAVVACHGDLADADQYVSTAPRAQAALAQLQRLRPAARLLVCGHTHRALLFGERSGALPTPTGRQLGLPHRERWLVNPGAVGQAREGRPLARYALLDLERGAITYLGIGYDHGATRRKLRRLGLVARVVLRPPRGPIARRIEHIRLLSARRWADQRLQHRRSQ